MRNSKKKCEEHEQYGQRLCLRIKGLTKKIKQDANDVLNQVRNLFKEAEVEIPDAVLDRAHRISKENNYAIVHFTIFRRRTLFYRNRKKLKNQIIHLDLTKSRLSLLNEARMKILLFVMQISTAAVSYDLRTTMNFFRNIRCFKKQIIWLIKRFKRVNLCCQWSLFDFKLCLCYYH